MIKSKIEAVLFLTDKPMKAAVIARTLNEDVQVVRQGLLELIHDYEERKSGLEVADDNGYIIQVKDEYSSLINEFAPLDMPLALLRTLSAIAIKQPVQQSEIIKIRGAGAYDHIKDLMVRELVIKKDADEGQGRSPLLSTTKKFQEYFRLSGDGKSLRTELRKKDVREEKSTSSESESQLVVPGIFSDLAEQVSGAGTQGEGNLDKSQVDELLSLASEANQVDELLKAAEEISQAIDELDSALSTSDKHVGQNTKHVADSLEDSNSASNDATRSIDKSETASTTADSSNIDLAHTNEAVEALQELFDSSPDNSLIFREQTDNKENKSARTRLAREVEADRPQDSKRGFEGESENSLNSANEFATEE